MAIPGGEVLTAVVAILARKYILEAYPVENSCWFCNYYLLIIIDLVDKSGC